MLRDATRVAAYLLHQPVVQTLAQAAAAEGVDAQLVGGVLRDRLLGLAGADFDATLGGRGREVAGRLAKSLGARLVELGGKEFGAFRLVGTEFVLDLWDREGGALADDLWRRDLTVNALALTLPDGSWIDPTGGLADLAAGRLRMVRADAFAADPLRVLRLPRFWLQLPGFALDPGTLAGAHRAAASLATVAAERVREELDKIFRHPEAHRGLALVASLDLYPGLWRGRPGEPGATGHAVLHLARLAPRALELRQRAPAALAKAIVVDHPLARWAVAFAELGSAASDHLEAFTRAGYLPKHDRTRLAPLLTEFELPRGEVAGRRFLHRHGAQWATALTLLGARTSDEAEWRQRAADVLALLARLGPEIFDPPRLLDGREVAALLGIGPGPALGGALAALREAQVDGRVESRQKAQEFLQEIATGRSGRART